MDESSGRGHREKKPSEKVKEQVSGKIEKIEDDKSVVLPTYIAPNDSKFLQDQKEVPKIYDHTKISPDGTKIDFYSLGQQYGGPPSISAFIMANPQQCRKQRKAILCPGEERSTVILFPRRRSSSSICPTQRREPSSVWC